ncbi:MAG: hypothetical protein ACJ74O_15865 [Frankiaceae bacterium]
MSHRTLRRTTAVCTGALAALALAGAPALAGSSGGGADASGLLPSLTPTTVGGVPLPLPSLPLPTLPGTPTTTPAPPAGGPTATPSAPMPTTTSGSGAPPTSGGGTGGTSGGTSGSGSIGRSGSTAGGGLAGQGARGQAATPASDAAWARSALSSYGPLVAPNLLSSSELGMGGYRFAPAGDPAAGARPPLVAGAPAEAVPSPPAAGAPGASALQRLAGAGSPDQDGLPTGLAALLATVAVGAVAAGHLGHRRSVRGR